MVSIRPMVVADIKVFLEWQKNHYCEDLRSWSGDGYVYPITSLQLMKRLFMFQKQQGAVYIAILDETVLGTIEVEVHPDLTATIGRFLIFDEGNRGKGYGGLILQSIIAEVKSHFGVEMLMLKVDVHNDQGIRCYEKAGFRIREISGEDEADHYYMIR